MTFAYTKGGGEGKSLRWRWEEMRHPQAAVNRRGQGFRCACVSLRWMGQFWKERICVRAQKPPGMVQREVTMLSFVRKQTGVRGGVESIYGILHTSTYTLVFMFKGKRGTITALTKIEHLQ